MIEEWMRRGFKNTMQFMESSNTGKYVPVPTWLGNEQFHASHRSNLLRKDFEYYSQFNWTENPESPYVWHDVENQWYEQHVGTGQRVYL